MLRRLVILVVTSAVTAGIFGVYYEMTLPPGPARPGLGTPPLAGFSDILARWDKLAEECKSPQAKGTDKETDAVMDVVLTLMRDTAARMEPGFPKAADTLSLAEKLERVLVTLPPEVYLRKEINVLGFLCQEQILAIRGVSLSGKLWWWQKARLARLAPKHPLIDADTLRKALEDQSGGTLKLSGGDLYEILYEAIVSFGLFNKESISPVREVLLSFSPPPSMCSNDDELRKSKIVHTMKNMITLLMTESAKAFLFSTWEYRKANGAQRPEEKDAVLDMLDPTFAKMMRDSARNRGEMVSNVLQVLNVIGSPKGPYESGEVKMLRSSLDMVIHMKNKGENPFMPQQGLPQQGQAKKP